MPFHKSFPVFISIILLGINIPLSSLSNSPSVILKGIVVSTWMYQIQDLYEREDIAELDETTYDLLVIEPGHNFIDFNYETEFLVNQLKYKDDGTERILLAYIDIGQAEDYRDYWGTDWVAPESRKIGYPEYILTVDPDGWSGNYPVAFWDGRWQELWLGRNGIIQKLAQYGFDGVYLDWVEAYDDDTVRDVAEEKNIDTELEMMKFIERIGDRGKSFSPGFLVVPQNAPYLLDSDPEYYSSIIDAIATEDTWYYGKGDVHWNHWRAGDLRGGDRHADDYSTKNRIIQNKKYLALGIPVFTIDYCISERKAERTYETSRSLGFIPLVSRVSLSEVTETPPY